MLKQLYVNVCMYDSMCIYILYTHKFYIIHMHTIIYIYIYVYILFVLYTFYIILSYIYKYIVCIGGYRQSTQSDLLSLSRFVVVWCEAGVVPDFAALKGLLSPLPPAPLVGPGNVPIFEAWPK